jgi:hypothetical protein
MQMQALEIKIKLILFKRWSNSGLEKM